MTDPESGEELLARGRRILAGQPFSAFLGAELARFDREDGVELRLPMRPEFLQHHGFAHGGVLSYAADNALTFAGGMALGGRPVLTSEFKINYTRPGVGDTLIARAKAVYAGRTQAVATCQIFMQKDGVETLIAVAQGTTVAVEPRVS
jgi:uncharacterized protein (TIGR00369 family)